MPSMMRRPDCGLLLAALVAVVLLHPTTTQELDVHSHSPAASDVQGESASVGDDALHTSDLDVETDYDTVFFEEDADADADEQTLLLQLADETAAVNADISMLLELDTTGGAVVRHAANVLGGAHVVRQTARRASSWYTGDHLIPHEADGARLDVAEAQRAAEKRVAGQQAATSSFSSAEHAAKEAAPALRGNAGTLPKAVAAPAVGAATLQAAHQEAHLAFADAQAKADLAAHADAEADAEADVDADADAEADAEEGEGADADAEGEQEHDQEQEHGQSAAGAAQWPSMASVKSAASSLFSKLKTFASDAASGGIGNALMNARSSLGIGQCPGRPVPCSGRGSCDMKTKKCTCNKPWSGAGCDVNRAYGRRSFFGCHLQPLPPAITEVCNTAINVQHRCPGYRLLAYSLCNHTCPLVENFGCGIGNVSHVCADPLIKCPDLCISMLSWYCELDAWGAKLVRLGKKPDSVPHPLSGMYRKGKYEGDSMFNKLGNLLGSSAGTAALGSVAGALGGKLPGFG